MKRFFYDFVAITLLVCLIPVFLVEIIVRVPFELIGRVRNYWTIIRMIRNWGRKNLLAQKISSS